MTRNRLQHLGAVGLAVTVGLATSSVVPSAPATGYRLVADAKASSKVALIDKGSFLVACGFSHRNHDDPIVFPRQPGRAHDHTYFGNRSTNAFSTPASLRKHRRTSCGRGRQPGGPAYWVPTLLVGGKAVKPIGLLAHYVRRTYARVDPFPAGLKMIAGHMNARSPQPRRVTSWSCADPPNWLEPHHGFDGDVTLRRGARAHALRVLRRIIRPGRPVERAVVAVWRCLSARMLERYNAYVGKRHLDVGVGTGWFLDHCNWPVEAPQITLLDLNENSLSVASKRIRRYAPATIQANVLDPVDLGDVRFDSIGANYLFHCLPGEPESKAATVASSLRPYLASDGVLFGSTILGRGVRHNLLGRRLMRLYNRKGIFSNLEDDQRGLEQGLRPS